MTQSERNSVGDANLVSFIQLSTGLNNKSRRSFLSGNQNKRATVKPLDEAKWFDG